MSDTTVAVGQKYGFWEVVAYAGPIGRSNTAMCICACKQIKMVSVRSLLRGESLSCGCRQRVSSEKQYQARMAGRAAAQERNHGWSGTPLYKTWLEMRRLDKNKRKRTVLCPEWQEFVRFKDWSLANGYADTHTLVRTAHYRGHWPDNCAWVPTKEVRPYEM